MENEPEVIRDQLQGTRTALTEKLEALEQTVARTVENTTRPVVETVQTVTEATKETVGAVKDTVQQLRDTVTGGVEKTVETVKETFNLSRQVRRHPWGMMLGSAAAGYLLGRLLPPASDLRDSFGTSMGSRMASAQSEPGRAALVPEPRGHNGHGRGPDGAARESEPAGESWLGGLMDTYHDEVEKLKGMGIAAVMGVVRDLVKQSVQGEIGDRLSDWVNNLTEKMGGKPFSGPVLETRADDPAAAPAEGPYEGPGQAQTSTPAPRPSKGAQPRKGRGNFGPLPGG